MIDGNQLKNKNMVLAITIISIIIIGILSFIIYNLNKKVIKLEDIVDEQIDYLRKVSLTIVESNAYVDQLDQKGHLRSDDEIGTFFAFMKEIQDIINAYTLPDNYGKKTT